MVSPIYLIVITLGAAFLLGLLSERRTELAHFITVLALAVGGLVSFGWLWIMAAEGASAVEIYTAGTKPPFAINLRVGLPEATLLLLIYLTGLMSAIHMKDMLLRKGRRAMAVLLIAIMALAGIIMTRDIFNIFVFFELVAISTGGMVLLSDDPRALGAGIKYLIIAQVISILLLVGIIFTYQATGSLNIDFMNTPELALEGVGALAFFLLLVPLLVELKPFPANGWALDIYQSAHPAFSALLSAATGSAALFAVDKIMDIGGASWGPVLTGVGLLSFVVSNILALVQKNDRRLLGYSSVAQTGLILAVIGQRDMLGESYFFIAGGLLIGHAVAKAGLFWLSGLVKGRMLTNWADLRRNPLLVFAFATFIAMLSGLPPFPGFYAKWELVHALMASGKTGLVALILFGALLEAGYLFRWFGYMMKRTPREAPGTLPLRGVLVVMAAALAGWLAAYIWGELSGYDNLLGQTALLFALGFLLIDWLPAKLKNTIAIAGMLAFFWQSYGAYDPIQMIFGIIILVGGAVILLASYNERGQRIGFYPSALLMFAGLAMLIVAEQSFQFFAAWEVLTLGSYFLILRGKNAEPHALSYILFSLAGAFAIIAGFALAAQGQAGFMITDLADVAADVAPWVFILLAIGFMTKTAVIGLHIWLPGAHAEAETDVSPMVSGILLKAGLFGIIVLLINMGAPELYGVKLTYVMLWIGALTALMGNLMAAFQEDAKRLLAYSSIGQMGYAIFGLALMNHLGWLMALMFVINHYIYKSMLFLSIGGVAKRTGTKLMYKMGGLITLMPLSFFVVLIGIIAVSGVPPLSGFGGRWLFYNAILDSENRLPMIIIFISGPIAFLYLFRLIHTIFLGQLKDEHRKLKEPPFWIMVPQVIYVVLLLAFAVLPGMALQKVDTFLDGIFPEGGLNWDGLLITSDYGYWSPVAIMVVTGGIFAAVFMLLLMINRKAQKVKQFNIVFSAERPYRPETTHFAWNFFAPYRKAIWPLLLPIATRFWGGVTEALHATAGFMRR
ncbi:MAG TPA: NADH-quinone oxidoreductase subunit F, partial [Rhodobacteraceae bacterium]|nr:NADH-quinone oxidoreductase subunit F [Paracoccaceae bacterium]